MLQEPIIAVQDSEEIESHDKDILDILYQDLGIHNFHILQKECIAKKIPIDCLWQHVEDALVDERNLIGVLIKNEPKNDFLIRIYIRRKALETLQCLVDIIKQ